MINVFIPGIPVPQGSKKAFVVGKRAVLVEANKDKLKPWRQMIMYALEHFDPFEGAVQVTAVFVFPRPKSVKRKHMSVKPDLDKLQRALGDGMTDSGIIADDSRIVEWRTSKKYARAGQEPGVELTIQEAS